MQKKLRHITQLSSQMTDRQTADSSYDCEIAEGNQVSQPKRRFIFNQFHKSREDIVGIIGISVTYNCIKCLQTLFYTIDASQMRKDPVYSVYYIAV